MGEPTASERKTFMRVLATLAWADGEVADEELELLHLTASDLGVALNERDLEERDLEALAAKVTHPDLQRRLLAALGALAEADGRISPEELSTIRFFAERFRLDLPAVPGVDWAEVPSPEAPPLDEGPEPE